MQNTKRKKPIKLSINQQEIQTLQKIYYTLTNSLTSILSEIIISLPDIFLIQNTITNLTYQNQLINLHNQILLLNSETLHFFTDVSIKYSQMPNIKTSIA